MLRTGAGLLRWAGTKQGASDGSTGDGPADAPPSSEGGTGPEDDTGPEDETGPAD